MSDDEATNVYNANTGVTLPGAPEATHDGSLSPLFLGRTGVVASQQALWRGDNGYYWSIDSSSTWSNIAYYYAIFANYTWPSGKDARTSARSLRCLVSTNNGL